VKDGPKREVETYPKFQQTSMQVRPCFNKESRGTAGIFPRSSLSYRVLHEIPRDIGACCGHGAMRMLQMQDQRGTLEDQASLGRFRISCGLRKYEGCKYRKMICDRCGVKVTSPSVRRERFGILNSGRNCGIFRRGEPPNRAFPLFPQSFSDSSAVTYWCVL